MDCTTGFAVHDFQPHSTSSSSQITSASGHEQEVVETKSSTVTSNLKFWKWQARVYQRTQGHEETRVGQKRKLTNKVKGGKMASKKDKKETIPHQVTVSGAHGLAEAAEQPRQV